MRKLMMLLTGLLLSSATAWAQDEAKAPTTPTNLPGEENLSAQERAERDFLMPVRRKQAAKLRAAAAEASVSQPALDATIEKLEAVPEPTQVPAVVPPVLPAAPAAVAVPRQSAVPHRAATHKKTTRRR